MDGPRVPTAIPVSLLENGCDNQKVGELRSDRLGIASFPCATYVRVLQILLAPEYNVSTVNRVNDFARAGAEQ